MLKFLCAGAMAVMAMAATSGHAAALQSPQARLDQFAGGLGYQFSILNNHVTDNCPTGQACFLTTLTLTAPDVVPDAGWAMYLSLVARFSDISDSTFDLTHIQGDLYRLSLKPGVTLKPGAKYTLELKGNGRFFSEYYPMPNAYVAADGLKPAIISATRAKLDPQTGQEVLPFVTSMTDEAALAAGSPHDATQWLTPERAYQLNQSREAKAAVPEYAILPAVESARHLGGKAIDLKRGIKLHLEGVTAADLGPALAAFPRKASGVPVSVRIDKAKGAEAYAILAKNGAITITAGDASGAYYALQSLAQQAAYEHNALKPLQIEDAPRFGFRGMHLDVARNFQGKAQVLKVIGQMGRYKLNRLHLHLGDDEGWRLAIDDLPELTDIGSKRCHDLKEDTCLLPQLGAGPFADAPVNGYLSRADYIDILKAAQANHIEVIPSFDMPGHSRAAVRSMEARYRHLMAAGDAAGAGQYRLADPADKTVYASIQNYSDNTLNICLDTTYAFIAKIMDTVASYHKQAGVPLKRYHIGADETAGAWVDSPACQAMMAKQGLTQKDLMPYFLTRVTGILSERHIEAAGWSDGMGHLDPATAPKVAQSNSWGMLLYGGVAEAQKQANQGWEIVMSSPDVLYLDMPYAADPKERGYDWASRGTDLFKVFAFMPQNLPANASLMTNMDVHGTTVADTEPLTSAHQITGMQGQLWSETVRSPAIADYMVFPRLLALAERAWHRASWELDYVAGKSYTYGDGAIDQSKLLGDWSDFQARLGAQLPQLDKAGVQWRVPTPGGQVSNGQLYANAPMQGVTIEYKTTAGWKPFLRPSAVAGPVQLRTRFGNRVSRIVTVQ